MKAIILTSQRTGSTFLQVCLDSHPAIKCYGEMMIGGHIELPATIYKSRFVTKATRFALIRGWSPASVLQRFYQNDEAQVVAFKAMYNHIASEKALQFLQQHTDIRIMHLRRGNLLKQYVSKLLMSRKRDGIWRPHSTYTLPVATTAIVPEQAIQEMDRVMARYKRYNELFANHSKVELVYEDMIDGNSLTSATTSSLCELLEVEPAPMTCDFVKSNPNDLKKIVENYDELAAALTGTEYEKHLHEN